jgi:hypothetical protein
MDEVLSRERRSLRLFAYFPGSVETGGQLPLIAYDFTVSMIT